MTIDWTSGTWSAQPVTSTGSSRARITVASDWLPLRAFAEVIRERPLAVYGDLLPALAASDLNLVNVECVLGDAGKPIPKNGPCLRGDVASADSLRQANFRVACLANNHILDCDSEGLANTRRVLQEAGLQTVGAGTTGEEAAKPLLVEVKGMRLAIINCAEGEACCSIRNSAGANGFEVMELVRQIGDLKKRADAVVVIFHGGREYAPLPPEYVVASLRLLAEAGAAAIVAHHPHVPQGIEIHGGVPIIYSQGNFVFWQESDHYFRHVGYLVHLDWQDGKLAGLELTPYRISNTGLSMLQGVERERLYGYLQTVSQPLARPECVQAGWDAWVDHEGERGLLKYLEAFLALYPNDPATAAGRFHNMFFCPAHRECYTNGLKRIAQGRFGDSPQWAKELVTLWTTLRL